MSESSLHKELKAIYAGADGLQEQNINGFYVDVLLESKIIEIQNGNFANQKLKLAHLLNDYQFKIVLPIPKDKYLVTISNESNKSIKRRLSPKHRNLAYLFKELVYIVDYLQDQNFQLEVVIIIEEEIRKNDGAGSWRRKGISIVDHRLIDILQTYEFKSLEDFIHFIPESFPNQFTTKDLATYWKIPRNISQRMAYSLRKMGLIHLCGKEKRANLYKKSDYNFI